MTEKAPPLSRDPTAPPRHAGKGGTSQTVRHGVLFALAAVVCFASAAVLVRWAAPVSSFEIAFWRLAIAALAVLAVARLRRQALAYRRADLPLLTGAGLVTAVHFLTFVTALFFTSVAHALSLVYTAPIFVALLAAWRLHERPRLLQLVGMAVAIVGVGVLTGFEPRFTPRMLIGDLLALISAASFAVYSVAGRGVRDRYPLLPYAAAVYGLAAGWLLPVAAITFDATQYSLSTVLVLLALGLIPIGLGHTFYNAALRRMPAASVNIVATQEVTGGVLLAWLLLAEAPAPAAILGVCITLAGVMLVLWPPRSS